jgi:hypothetical protein
MRQEYVPTVLVYRLLLYISPSEPQLFSCQFNKSKWYFSALLHASRALPPPSSAHAPVPA